MVSFNLQLVKMSFSVDRKTFQILSQPSLRKPCRHLETPPLVSSRNLPRTQTSLFWWKCARKGRREGDNRRDVASPARLYPSHGPLRFITSHSFRARLCHAKNEGPEEEAVAKRHSSNDCKNSAFFFRLVAAFAPRQVALLSHIPPTVTGVWYDDNETRITGL